MGMELGWKGDGMETIGEDKRAGGNGDYSGRNKDDGEKWR